MNNVILLVFTLFFAGITSDVFCQEQIFYENKFDSKTGKWNLTSPYHNGKIEIVDQSLKIKTTSKYYQIWREIDVPVFLDGEYQCAIDYKADVVVDFSLFKHKKFKHLKCFIEVKNSGNPTKGIVLEDLQFLKDGWNKISILKYGSLWNLQYNGKFIASYWINQDLYYQSKATLRIGFGVSNGQYVQIKDLEVSPFLAGERFFNYNLISSSKIARDSIIISLWESNEKQDDSLRKSGIKNGLAKLKELSENDPVSFLWYSALSNLKDFYGFYSETDLSEMVDKNRTFFKSIGFQHIKRMNVCDDYEVSILWPHYNGTAAQKRSGVDYFASRLPSYLASIGYTTVHYSATAGRDLLYDVQRKHHRKFNLRNNYDVRPMLGLASKEDHVQLDSAINYFKIAANKGADGDIVLPLLFTSYLLKGDEPKLSYLLDKYGDRMFNKQDWTKRRLKITQANVLQMYEILGRSKEIEEYLIKVRKTPGTYYYLGDLYSRGIEGIPEDLSKSTFYFKEACSIGSGKACSRLAEQKDPWAMVFIAQQYHKKKAQGLAMLWSQEAIKSQSASSEIKSEANNIFDWNQRREYVRVSRSYVGDSFSTWEDPSKGVGDITIGSNSLSIFQLLPNSVIKDVLRDQPYSPQPKTLEQLLSWYDDGYYPEGLNWKLIQKWKAYHD